MPPGADQNPGREHCRWDSAAAPGAPTGCEAAVVALLAACCVAAPVVVGDAGALAAGVLLGLGGADDLLDPPLSRSPARGTRPC